MTESRMPLVSVVIPVYNGAEFLANAIDSVLKQTYSNFDLTIGNNWSTDRTLEIAQEYAARDSRIRVVTYPKFVSVVDSHNTAFTLISPEAEYCKIVGADDWIFPDCLRCMVEVAEAYPSVGMVSSYVLHGTNVGRVGMPYPRQFVRGREICRMRFLEEVKPFGGPSASLIRATILKTQRPFYNPLNYHGDIEAYLELLKDHDFGFVFQVLSYNRKGEKSRTTAYLDRVESSYAAEVDELTKYGPVYLTPEEREPRLQAAWRRYYRFLGENALKFRNKEFWDYHFKHIKAMGYSLSRGRIAASALQRVLELALNPLNTARAILRRLAAT